MKMSSVAGSSGDWTEAWAKSKETESASTAGDTKAAQHCGM